MSRVLVAMSGGVDSAVAAALLVEAGHDVAGVHLKLADVAPEEQVEGQGCCTLDDASDARRTAAQLGIPFYVWDLRETFEAEVQAPFAEAYRSGRTPNPCVTCNEKVKYAALQRRALAVGFDALATGHHVRLQTPDGAPVTEPGRPDVRLVRAADRRKDQTYVLHMATPEQLAASLFPVGELTKDEVRDLAALHGFRVANKPDSYDVCFIPDGDTAGYLAGRVPSRPGDIVDLDGATLGRHDGIHSVTIGQRRGLGLGTHERRFVVDVDEERDRVVVGPRDSLATRWLEVADPVSTSTVGLEGRLRVQIRAHAPAVLADVRRVSGGTLRIEPDEPLYGVARGQAAVLYTIDDQHCLGGGAITAADRPSLPVS